MSFGDNLKKMRLDNGMTQDELARAVNTSRSNIANYENDKNMPSVDMLEKLAKQFKCSTDFLIGIEDFNDLQSAVSLYEGTVNILDKLSQFEIDFLEKEINSSFNSSGKPIKDTYYLDKVLCYPNLSKMEKQDLIHNLFSHFQIFYGMYPCTKGTHTFSVLYFKEFARLEQKEFCQMSQTIYSVVNYQYYNCPVYGRISAGQPNWAEECLEGYLPIDPNMMNIIDPQDHFFLRVNR